MADLSKTAKLIFDIKKKIDDLQQQADNHKAALERHMKKDEGLKTEFATISWSTEVPKTKVLDVAAIKEKEDDDYYAGLCEDFPIDGLNINEFKEIDPELYAELCKRFPLDGFDQDALRENEPAEYDDLFSDYGKEVGGRKGSWKYKFIEDKEDS